MIGKTGRIMAQLEMRVSQMDEYRTLLSSIIWFSSKNDDGFFGYEGGF